jgi:putative nicotinate phosphoribosyltransferase
MIKKAGDTPGITLVPAQTAGAAAQVQEAQKAQQTKGLTSVDGKDSAFAPRMLEAARARDLDTVKSLTTAWVGAQSSYEALTDGLLALSNFLRVFGSGETDPKLYANLLSLNPPTDRPMDAGTLELKGGEIQGMGKLLQAIATGHLKGEIDINAGDQLAAKSLLMAANMGLMTDALKVKMVGWNKLTDQLAHGSVSFELGIRKMPEGSNTNFWVVGGVNKAVEWVNNLRISPEAVEWMKGHALFKNYPKAFFEYFTPPTQADGTRTPGGLSDFEKDLKKVKIDALPDGEVYVGGPIMRVSGPPAAVEFIESNVMRLVTSATTVATAAAQMTIGADGKPVAYFGLRRAPGFDDDSTAISQAAALGGMTVTSDLMAGFLGAPLTGTMEHSIMMMLKTVFKHDPPREFTAKEQQLAADYLRQTWRAAEPGISDKELNEKVKAQVEDVLVEAYVFAEYSYKNDKENSVALIDTSHPNIGTAAAMLAQEMIWAEHGKEAHMKAIRLDSGVLLAQGLQFRQVLNEAGMGALNIMATDGLLPETVKFFEGVEKELRKAEGGKLPASFYAMMEKAPESVAEDAKEKATITAMAEGLAKSGGLKPGQPLFSGYGAGEKIADSVSTVGRPGIVYKAAQLTFPSETAGENVTVPLGKLASPSKATGPERELFAKMGADGKVEQWIIASPSEVDQAGGKVQRLMRTVLEEGQAKVTPHKQAVAYAAARRELLPDAVKNGDKAPLGMTAQYKEEWLDVVRKSDETRVAEFQAYFDKMWPTVEI